MQIPLDTEALERAGEARRGLLPYLEMAAKLLELLESVLAVFSKCALKSLNNQADFDSAIRRFDQGGHSLRKSMSCGRLKSFVGNQQLSQTSRLVGELRSRPDTRLRK
jgi:hypothetical protein